MKLIIVDGIYYLIGRFITTDELTINDRIYPNHVIKKNIESHPDNWLGELGCPNGLGIDLVRVSHQVIETWNEGNDWLCKAQILNTPCGMIVKAIVDQDPELLTFIPAGLGTLIKVENGYLVKDDYVLSQIYLSSNQSVMQIP